MVQVERASCLVTKDDSLLLVKIDGFWNLPGGEVPKGEDPEDFAAKMTEEQTGIKVNILQQFESYETQRDGKNIEERVFEALADEGGSKTGDGVVSAEWVKKAAIKAAETAESLKQVLQDLDS